MQNYLLSKAQKKLNDSLWILLDNTHTKFIPNELAIPMFQNLLAPIDRAILGMII